jgi:GntR family transcriptional regulator
MSDDCHQGTLLIKRSTPITQQVVLILEKRIRGGQYEPGDRLPSESEFAKELGVSRATLRTALAKLETAGLILRKHGNGTYVAQLAVPHNGLPGALWQFDHQIKLSGREPIITVPASKIRPASEREHTRLQLEEGADVLSVLRLFCADNTPVILSMCVFPTTLFTVPLDEVDFSLGIQDILSQHSDQAVAYTNANIAAVAADEPAQSQLGVPAGAPLLHLREVFFNRRDELSIMLSDSYLHTDELDLQQVRPWY